MLGIVMRKVSNTWQYATEYSALVNKFCESCDRVTIERGRLYSKVQTWYLSRASCPNFRLVVLQELYIRIDHFVPDNIFTDSFGELGKS